MINNKQVKTIMNIVGLVQIIINSIMKYNNILKLIIKKSNVLFMLKFFLSLCQLFKPKIKAFFRFLYKNKWLDQEIKQQDKNIFSNFH